jgi:hypothetical protein
MVKLLLQYKADPNTKPPWSSPPSPLTYWALNIGDTEMLKALLAAGADANATDSAGMPLLVQSAVNGSAAAMELLLAHGAKPDIAAPAGRTALGFAAEHCLQCVESLLAANADANASQPQGITPLHLAVNQGLKELVEALLAKGAAINAQTESGDTPLHWAIRLGDRGSGSARMLELLLAKGANPNIRNREDQTPLDFVKQPNSAGRLPGMPGQPPLPQPGQRGPMVSTTQTTAESKPTDLATLLRQHGARDDLPKLDRIEVRRPSPNYAANYSATVFWKGKQDWNQHTLLELIAAEYGILATRREVTQYGHREVKGWPIENERKRKNPLPFPELSRVIIRRPTADGQSRETLTVDAAALLESGDCAKDVPLQWGDVVEIAEADHPINEQWPGFSAAALKTMKECLTRKVSISVKDQTMVFTLAPSISFEGDSVQLASNRRFTLLPVLEESKLLRASSDLSRIKVTRRAAGGGKPREWVVDGNVSDTGELWLRDGDVIEVPDKP